MDVITTYEEAVDYVLNIPRFTTKNSMEDTRAFLKKLGYPDRALKIIHVAGTNGKGSVTTYMASVLRASGYKVGVFTSPHLVDIRERFMVDGELISREEFLSVFLQVKKWITQDEGGYHPTFFEYLFFMSLLYFKEKAPDYCILETGLGGRLDATNSVEHKELCVITHISLDHMQYLGDTVTQIAGEKAGILMKEVPVVYWDTSKEVTQVITERAFHLQISSDPVSNKDYAFLGFQYKTIDFSYYSRYYSCIRLSLHTLARYQMENVTLALRALEVLDQGRTITANNMKQGIEAAFWAGRMEEIAPDIYVDGAHNEDGIRAFLESVRQDGYTKDRHLLFGVVKDKDYTRMIGEVVESKLFTDISVVHLQNSRGLTLEALKDLFSRYPQIPVCYYEQVEEAVIKVKKLQSKGDVIYMAGSLYLVGEVKETFYKNSKEG